MMKSDESEAGVKGLILSTSPLCDRCPQELMHTSASTASKSFCSKVLHVDLSLSCLFLSRMDSQISMKSTESCMSALDTVSIVGSDRP